MVITQAERDKQEKEEKYHKYPGVEDKCQESTQEVNEDIFGIIPSSTHYGAYYLITGKDNLKCSCPARVVCKHLKDIKNGNTTCIRVSRTSKK